MFSPDHALRKIQKHPSLIRLLCATLKARLKQLPSIIVRNYFANVTLHARSKNVENPPRKRANGGTLNGVSANLCLQTDATLVVPTQRIAFLRVGLFKN